MTRWVLADYGEVISDPMPAETILELADLAGQQADEFRDRYWKFRPPYDLGQSDLAYWSAVLGHELRAEPQLVEAMVRVDVAGWMTLNPRTLPALIKFGAHAGVRLAEPMPQWDPLVISIARKTAWADSPCRLCAGRAAGAPMTLPSSSAGAQDRGARPGGEGGPGPARDDTFH